MRYDNVKHKRKCETEKCTNILIVNTKSKKIYCDECVAERGRDYMRKKRKEGKFIGKPKELKEERIASGRRCTCEHGYITIKNDLGFEYCDYCDYVASIFDIKGNAATLKRDRDTDKYTPEELEEVLKRRAYQKQYYEAQKVKRKTA